MAKVIKIQCKKLIREKLFDHVKCFSMVIISKHLLIINSKCETLNTRTLQRLKVTNKSMSLDSI